MCVCVGVYMLRIAAPPCRVVSFVLFFYGMPMATSWCVMHHSKTVGGCAHPPGLAAVNKRASDTL